MIRRLEFALSRYLISVCFFKGNFVIFRAVAGVGLMLCAVGMVFMGPTRAVADEPQLTGGPYVPTPQRVVDAMLGIAGVSDRDFVIDLGSGDGRTVIAAAKRGVRALGLEYNPDMVALSELEAKKAGVTDKASFQRADIFVTDFTRATVVTMYLLPSLNMKLRPQLLDMKPGTRLVSHAFSMGDWEPDESAYSEERKAMLWIVPAKVGGNWRVQIDQAGVQPSDASFKQTFQKIEGTMRVARDNHALFDARLRGDEVRFTVLENPSLRRDFVGRVEGDRMFGTVRSTGQGEAKFTATRK